MLPTPRLDVRGGASASHGSDSLFHFTFPFFREIPFSIFTFVKKSGHNQELGAGMAAREGAQLVQSVARPTTASLPAAPHPLQPTAFLPNFSIQTAIKLPATVGAEQARTMLLAPAHIESVIRLSPLCTTFERLPSMPCTDGECERFLFVERVPVVCGLSTNVTVDAAQRRMTPDELIYESHANNGVVWVRKRRRIMAPTAEEPCVRVEETIEGRCPAALRGLTQREAAKAHADHLAAYATLF